MLDIGNDNFVKPGELDVRRHFADVLTFWFGNLNEQQALSSDDFQMKRWYGKDPEIDRDIENRFGATHRELAGVVLAGWDPADTDEALAAIIILDQFPRNMYRGSRRMYETDELALAISRRFSERPEVAKLDLYRAMFIYMPLMHSELLSDQESMLVHFDRLAKDARDRSLASQDFFTMARSFADRHREIVARFGRFPHRNDILGRTSTGDEFRFLQEENSSF